MTHSVSLWREDQFFFDSLEDAEKFFERERAAREAGAGEIYEWAGDTYSEVQSFNLVEDEDAERAE
ncbi:MAG: hypothetical protein M3438_00545 [Pseudomonadota bacterium]|nr:hypothetical protein [Pseudomonadota bacterium]